MFYGGLYAFGIETQLYFQVSRNNLLRFNTDKAKINLLIENFALEETKTGKNRGRIQQLILETDFPKLREEIGRVINALKELERFEKRRSKYDNTDYKYYCESRERL